MPARDLPNLGLKAGYDPGENGWGDDMTANLLKLSALTQATVIDKVAATPGAPAAGAIYLFDGTHPTNANDIAIFDGPTGEETWSYVTPDEGWLVFNKAADYYEKFDGAVWAELATGGGGGGIADAPADGTTYGRKDNAWAEIISGSGSSGGFISFAIETTTSGTISSSAAATKGNIFTAEQDFHLVGMTGRFDGTGTYKAIIAEITGADVITEVLGESSSVVIADDNPDRYREFTFASPVKVPAGARFAALWVRTDGTGTAACSVPFPAGQAAPTPAYTQVPGITAWVATNAPTVGTDLTNPTTGDFVCAMTLFTVVYYGELETGADKNVVYPFRGARVERTANIAVGAVATIPWTSEVYDYGGWHDNATNNTRLTVPEGVTRVRITGQFTVQSPSGGQSFSVRKNGNTSVQFATTQVGNSAYSFTVQHFDTGVIEVVPGDYFEAYSEGSSTLVPSRTFFQIEAVSDKVVRADFAPTLNAQSGAAYSLADTDDGNIVEMTNGAANTVTIPANSTTSLPVGAMFAITQIGAGPTTIQAAAGVTLNGVAEGAATITGQWGGVSLYQRAADEWVIQGAHGGVA